MLPTRQGSFRLFRVAGIDVFLHWSWFVVALYELNSRTREYSTFTWNVLEYVSLFAIVLMHEFGHALACRQVGGKAEQIILWPLGGVAYVAPPQRPGAMLWSIAAGPLVNVLLAPALTGLLLVGQAAGWPASMPDVYGLLKAVWGINLCLLVFNLLPIFPLDGGQILRSLLWFALGRARSLMVAVVIGFVGAGGLLLLAIFVVHDTLFFIMCAFILLNCWKGLMAARVLGRLAGLPRREGFACPDCHQGPVKGPIWRCGKCRKPFDMFETQAVCPHCGAHYPVTHCVDCGSGHPVNEWALPGQMPLPPGSAA
jgi:Zn-dependent protease